MTTIATPQKQVYAPGFVGLEAAQNQFNGLLQATATNMREFTVRQDYLPEIGDYLRRDAPLWSRLRKEPAPADLVQEIRRTALPVIGFSNKQDLATGPSQPTGNARNRNDLSDPGQQVKALSGFIDWSHYARSLALQQGNPYGDQVAQDTDDMIAAAARLLELTLWRGNAATAPLEFNGILTQRPAGNTFTLDLTDTNEERTLGNMLIECIARIVGSRRIARRVTGVFCSNCGYNLVQREVEAKRLFTEVSEVTPGLNVPGIRTGQGVVPIEPSSYIDDEPGDGVGGGDLLRFIFLDIDKLRWMGVRPMGGLDTFDPQVFEITQFLDGVPLTEKQMLLIYGTLYAMNLGDSIWSLEVTVPAGTAWNYED
jgi:hypothetical protein